VIDPNTRPVPRLSVTQQRTAAGLVFPSQLEIVREKHRRGIPGLSLAEFVVAAWDVIEPATPLIWNWHIGAVADHLEGLLLDRAGPNGEPCPTNLLVNVPPGSMKSTLLSCATAWMWLFRPSWRAIFASGTPSVVTRDSLKCRALIASHWYQQTFAPRWKISANQDEKTHYSTSESGFRKGISAGSALQGERGDFIAVDDPNSAVDIRSKAHCETIHRWWGLSLHNRVADPARSKRVLVMQRLGDADLAGHVLERERTQWAHLCLQQEFEPGGPGDRPTWLGWRDPRSQESELMFPARFTPEFVASEKVTLGSSGWAGQHQQRPSPAGGGAFKREWWRFFSPTGEIGARPTGCSQVPPRRINPAIDRFEEVIQSWDLSFKGGDHNDFVVGLVIGRIGADKFVLDMVREKLSFTETKRAIAKVSADWPLAHEKLVEDKANGPAIIDALGGEIAGIIAVNPLGGKEARAAAIEPQIEAGNVFLPENAAWLDTFVDEFASFPSGKHDDVVDSLGQGLARMGQEETEVARARLLLRVWR
jgi:predicted phage terminase large subunit-like protein